MHSKVLLPVYLMFNVWCVCVFGCLRSWSPNASSTLRPDSGRFVCSIFLSMLKHDRQGSNFEYIEKECTSTRRQFGQSRLNRTCCEFETKKTRMSGLLGRTKTGQTGRANEICALFSTGSHSSRKVRAFNSLPFSICRFDHNFGHEVTRIHF